MDGKPSGLEAVDFVAAYAGGDGPSSAARSDGGGSGSGGDGSGPPTAGTGDAGVELGAGPPRRRMAIRLVKEARCTRAHRAGSGAPTGSGGRASCTRPPPPQLSQRRRPPALRLRAERMRVRTSPRLRLSGFSIRRIVRRGDGSATSARSHWLYFLHKPATHGHGDPPLGPSEQKTRPAPRTPAVIGRRGGPGIVALASPAARHESKSGLSPKAALGLQALSNFQGA